MENSIKNNFSELQLSEIVKKNLKAAEVFEKYDLDFCCNGNKKLSLACDEKEIDINEVLDKLENIREAEQTEHFRFDDWELDFLVDYIINKHHQYVRKAAPVINEHCRKVVEVHSNHHPETVKIAEIFSSLYQELLQHMMKEERILFPYIKNLVKVRNGETKFEKPYFGRIGNPINMMGLEHQSAGESMYSIRELTNRYAIPSDACNTYKVCLKELKEFEEDLHKHVHLENNVLFPKSMLLEEELIGG